MSYDGEREAARLRATLPPEPIPMLHDMLARYLWECGVASGMDTDGDSGPEAQIAGMGYDDFAAAMVGQVRQLRRDYDECLALPDANEKERG